MRSSIVAIVLVLAPWSASAQTAAPPRPAIHANPSPAPNPHPPGSLGTWWKDSEVVRELGLSPAQLNQIETSFFDHRLKLVDLRADLDKQEMRLQQLLDGAQPDEAKASAQIDLVVAARGRLEKANTLMMLAIRRVLTADQWKRLQEVHHERGHWDMPAPAGQPVPRRQPASTPSPWPRPPEEEEALNLSQPLEPEPPPASHP